MSQQMMMYLGAADTAYDLRFIEMMILHHEGAIIMAQDASSKTARKELIDLAGRMIVDQNKEIAQMTAWRATWYGQ